MLRSHQAAFCGNGARTAALLAALFLTTACAVGCGGVAQKPQGRVHGKVTYKGAPVPAGSQIAFVPIETGTGATAEVAADGTYQLRTATGDTLAVGKYQVSVSPPLPTKGLSPAEAMKISQQADASGSTAAALPEKYLNPATSPENREVKEGDNEFNIELTD